MRTIFFAFFLLSFAAVAVAQNEPDWTYQGKTGTLNWGKLNPAYRTCARGREQSPVDMRSARLDTTLQPIQFHYLAGPVTLANNGRTVVATVNPGSYIVAAGVRYDLISYEFHHPSEHTLKGDFSDMEIDMLHRSADGKTAIVAVRLSEGNTGFANATLATLWQHLPMRTGQSEKIADMVNPGGLLPSDRAYWTYMGSQLEPPCSEGVRWYVFEQEVSISRRQYDAFAALYPMNTRPVQSLNGRRIQATE